MTRWGIRKDFTASTIIMSRHVRWQRRRVRPHPQQDCGSVRDDDIYLHGSGSNPDYFKYSKFCSSICIYLYERIYRNGSNRRICSYPVTIKNALQIACDSAGIDIDEFFRVISQQGVAQQGEHCVRQGNADDHHDQEYNHHTGWYRPVHGNESDGADHRMWYREKSGRCNGLV